MQEFFAVTKQTNEKKTGDETLLEGKTRADVPPEKQKWLNYLEQHGLLLEQFKK